MAEVKIKAPTVDPKKVQQAGDRIIRENVEWLKEMAKK